MTSGYLDVLDATLGDGAAQLSGGFRSLQAEHVARQQLPDGGFPGRQGASDLYYTDFAIRILVLSGIDSINASVLPRTAAYLAEAGPRLRTVVDCFSLLNSRRLLAARGLDVPLDRARVLELLGSQALASGGFAMPGGAIVGAYPTFIALLCYEALGDAFPDLPSAAREISALQCPSGGFRGQRGEGGEQTNATAAAIGFLSVTQSLPPGAAEASCAYLAAMQSPLGGLLAHSAASLPDLLSTFTGFLTLALLDSHTLLDLPALGRFVRACARADGGFSACPGDDGADVEYTYYGLACVALLRVLASDRRRGQDS